MKGTVLTKTAGLLFLSLISTARPATQSEHSITVQLRINRNYEQDQSISIKFDPQAAIGSIRVGRAPGGTLVEVEPVADPPNAYRIKVDSNGDGSLADDISQLIRPGAAVEVTVRRNLGSREELLRYSIEYERDVTDGKPREFFSWRPKYCAEGRLRIDGCESLLVVVDFNGDGLFDEKDSAWGSTIGLDRNGDGRIGGPGEWLSAKQIIDYCGKSFLIDNLKSDGSAITLVETTLRVPKAGEPLPSFSMKTLDGATIRSEELRTKVRVLDFWASWCKPCVEKFPEVKQLEKTFGSRIEIIGINVDESSRVRTARQIIKTHKLSWRQVITGRGMDDPIWKMFGGMGQLPFAIPLYVLITSDGEINYVGSGGNSLSELRAKTTSLTTAGTKAAKRYRM